MPPGGGPEIHTPFTWANTSWASFSLGQAPRCWDTGRIRPLLLPLGGKETQMSKAKASLYPLHPWDSKCRPSQSAPARNGGEPPNEAWGGRGNPGRAPCVCACLPECLLFPCSSSYLLTGPLLPRQGPSFPRCPSLRCSLPWRPEALLQDPFLIPAPSVALGAPFTATLHPELGLVSGMGLRAEEGNIGPQPGRGRGLGTSHPST